jgi:UDP-N-acetylmuramyl-tripeptide synthetase
VTISWPSALHPLSLRELIADEAAAWLRERLGPNAHLCSDSRDIKPGDGFLARSGQHHSLETTITDAVAAGAAAVVIDGGNTSTSISLQDGKPPTLVVPQLTTRLGMIASAFYGRPSLTMQLIAVTGTNGKSTVTAALAQALAHCGVSTAAIGTLGVGVFPARCGVDYSPQWENAKTKGLTTPDPVQLQRLLVELKAQSIHVVAIEASSIGLVQGRLQGCAIKIGAFINLSHDHLDFHGDMQRYAAAKALLFEAPSLGAAVINTGDAAGMSMWRATESHTERIAVGSSRPESAHAAIQVMDAIDDHNGWVLRLKGEGRAESLTGEIRLPIVGRHNIENAMIVAGCMIAMRIDISAIRAALEAFKLPAGRLQMVHRARGPRVCVDYAHSPDALKQILEALAPLVKSRVGALVCIFGCGGDRDRHKRPLMGEIAAQYADRVVLTSDNPRGESPETILDDIASGIRPEFKSKVSRQSDRALAIAQTIANSGEQDLIVIAGKGHEQTQLVGGQALHFSDADHAIRAIDLWIEEHQSSVRGLMHA